MPTLGRLPDSGTKANPTPRFPKIAWIVFVPPVITAANRTSRRRRRIPVTRARRNNRVLARPPGSSRRWFFPPLTLMALSVEVRYPLRMVSVEP